MTIVQICKGDSIIIEPKTGWTVRECIKAAQTFCQVFSVASVIIVHNNCILQVKHNGLVQVQR